MIGSDWILIYQKESTKNLKDMICGIHSLCRNDTFKKVYGYDEGLFTLVHFMEDIVERRENFPKKRSVIQRPYCPECKDKYVHMVYHTHIPAWQCPNCGVVVDNDKV